MRKGLKVKKAQITVEIPDDWKKIHEIGLLNHLVHFCDDGEENIRKIVAKWTGQDAKIVKANTYNIWRGLFAFIVVIVIFFILGHVFIDHIVERFSNKELWTKIFVWTAIAIGIVVGTCYFIFW